MQQAFENVEDLLNSLKPLLLEAGVPERQLLMPQGRKPEEIKLEKYVEAFDWLHRISISGEYAGVQKAKKLVSEETWAKYKAYNITGLQEQIILNNALLKLRRAWKTNRPSFFGKVFKDAEQEESEQDVDQQDTES